ncbi:MAG TPA: hypothetical protein VJJ47_01565 [Candidatus Paceibacterota bacterium]
MSTDEQMIEALRTAICRTQLRIWARARRKRIERLLGRSLGDRQWARRRTLERYTTGRSVGDSIFGSKEPPNAFGVGND